MPDLPDAHSYRAAGGWSGAHDRVTLTYDERFLRRKRLTAAQGDRFLVDLPETVSLNHGDAFVLDDLRLIEIIAAEEPLLEITGQGLVRLAWHIGNRHTPCQIEPARLLIRRDHVLEAMLAQLGAHVHLISAPFRPEGGAYGLGRTLGHAHGPQEAAHSHSEPEAAHSHGDSHGDTHDHGHGHTHVHRHVSPQRAAEDGEAQG